MSTQALIELEERVTRRFIETAAIDYDLPDDLFDVDEWSTNTAPPPTPQFPKPQWITYPNRRAIALLIVDRCLDLWDQLTDTDQCTAAVLLAYGGREQIA